MTVKMMISRWKSGREIKHCWRSGVNAEREVAVEELKERGKRRGVEELCGKRKTEGGGRLQPSEENLAGEV